MSIQLKIIGIVASLILSAIVFYLLRKKMLKESYSIFWGIISFLTIIIALWYNGVIIITELFDIDSPINGVFFSTIHANLKKNKNSCAGKYHFKKKI